MNLPHLLLLRPLLGPPLVPSVLPPHLRPPQLPLSSRRPPAASSDASAAHIFRLHHSDHSAPASSSPSTTSPPSSPSSPPRQPPPSPFPSRPHHPRPLRRRRRRSFARIGHGRALIVGEEAFREAIRSFGERIVVPALGFAALWARAVGGRLQDCIFGWGLEGFDRCDRWVCHWDLSSVGGEDGAVLVPEASLYRIRSIVCRGCISWLALFWFFC